MNKLFLVLVLSLAIALCSCDPKSDIRDLPVVNSGMALRYTELNTLEKIENYADYIVSGKFIDKPEQINAREDLDIGITKYPFIITKVYKGDLKEKDTISIGEDYYVADNNGKKTLITTDGYLPSNPGIEYVMFLNYIDKQDSPYYGIYYPVSGILGRYAKDNASFKKNNSPDNVTGIISPTPLYIGIYNNVLEKYK